MCSGWLFRLRTVLPYLVGYSRAQAATITVVMAGRLVVAYPLLSDDRSMPTYTRTIYHIYVDYISRGFLFVTSIVDTYLQYTTTRYLVTKMSKSTVNSHAYPFRFNSANQLTTKNDGNAHDVSVTVPNCRGRIPSFQASRFRTMMLEAHNDPSKILAHVCSYDALSARLCEEAGFPINFLAGYAMASAFGLPDTGYIAFQEVTAKVQEVVRVTNVPVLVDGDTGYGGPMNVRRTVEG